MVMGIEMASDGVFRVGLSNTPMSFYTRNAHHPMTRNTDSVFGHPVWLWSAVHKSGYSWMLGMFESILHIGPSAPASYKCVASAYSHPIAPHPTVLPVACLIPNLINRYATHSDTQHTLLPLSRMHKDSLEMV